MFSVKAAAFGVEALLRSSKNQRNESTSSEEEELIVVDSLDHGRPRSSPDIANTSGLHVKTDLFDKRENCSLSSYAHPHSTGNCTKCFEWNPPLFLHHPIKEGDPSHTLKIKDDPAKEPQLTKVDEEEHDDNPGRVITVHGISVELHHHTLWAEFHQHQTEMIITKNGRRMFPVVKARIFDLDPDAFYIVFLDIMSIDAKRYRYAYPSSRWVIAGTGEPLGHDQVYIHPDSPALGKQWLDMSVISFDKLKLTNNRVGETKGQIFLHSMQKYRPRIWIQRVYSVKEQPKNVQNNNGPINSVQLQVDKRQATQFTFPETSFITVTAYQNQHITKLKINSNPFAKGFRENSKQKESIERRFMTSISCNMHDTNQHFHLYESQPRLPRFFSPLQTSNPFLPFFPMPPSRLTLTHFPWPFVPTFKPAGTFFPPLDPALIPPFSIAHLDKSNYYKDAADLRVKRENT